ncbi:MAG: PHP domain-containing protein [Saprospiraceae bacterium]
MTNKEIAAYFNNLAKLMELYGENPFRIKSYQNVYIQLRKLGDPLADMSATEMEALKGIGKGASSKITEILSTGKLAALEELKAKTPLGIQDMLRLKGFGPKKIKQLWKELGIESLGELWYACNENRLVELKGFGSKTQADLKKKVEYLQQTKGQHHYASILPKAKALLALIDKKIKPKRIELVGEMGRYCPIVSQVEVLLVADDLSALFETDLELTSNEGAIYKTNFEEVKVCIYTCGLDEFGSKQFRYTSTKPFLESFLAAAKEKEFQGLATEEEVFAKAKLPYIIPEWRDEPEVIQLAQHDKLTNDLIEEKDIKGVVHAHTTYSDGINTLEEMVNYAQTAGYEYFTVTDHSKAAFYANGLKPDRVLEQFAAIDALNAKMENFTIFKGIESDILNDGSLDYEEDLLQQFDIIIASVHTNLKMEETKATKRLITAIENPYTTMLGHPTGRLLLSRQGYPIDHRKIIDACAANQVSIELNANPYRLDLDYNWIPYALDKGILISINPDAHSTTGIHDIEYGVLAARKGRLTKAGCLNARDAKGFKAFLDR